MNILGQDRALRYLLNGLDTNRLSPSLLFVGIEGIGKRSTGVELTKALLCSNPILKTETRNFPNCDLCESCSNVDKKTHSNLFYLNKELQADLLNEKIGDQSALKIESIRQLDRFLQLKSMDGKKRVAFIEDAHLLTTDAANAFLKMLEEPLPHTQLILLTTDEHILPTTIRSRCALVRFNPIGTDILSSWLIQTQQLTQEKAFSVACQSMGSFSKAIELKDQEATSSLDELDLADFFDLLSNPSWKKQGKERSNEFLKHLIEKARIKLEKGDFDQIDNLLKLFRAKRQVEHHVSPKLVLENIFIQSVNPSTQRI